MVFEAEKISFPGDAQVRLERGEYKVCNYIGAAAGYAIANELCNRECSFLRSDRRLITMEFV